MTDLTISDISAGNSAETDTSGGETATEDEKSTGEWLVEIFDRLDERGLVEPVLFGPDSNISKQTPDGQPAEQGGGDGMELDADAIADVGKTVIDTMGDVPISEVVKYAEKNPEQVNQLIEQKLEGDT